MNLNDWPIGEVRELEAWPTELDEPRWPLRFKFTVDFRRDIFIFERLSDFTETDLQQEDE